MDKVRDGSAVAGQIGEIGKDVLGAGTDAGMPAAQQLRPGKGEPFFLVDSGT